MNDSYRKSTESRDNSMVNETTENQNYETRARPAIPTSCNSYRKTGFFGKSYN